MADNKSRVIIEKENGEVVTYAANNLEEALAIEKHPTIKPKSVGQLHVKVNVDVSEALTGLKAIQREAKKAAQAIRELETAKSNFNKTSDNGDINE